jgi:hypothetical protein
MKVTPALDPEHGSFVITKLGVDMNGAQGLPGGSPGS